MFAIASNFRTIRSTKNFYKEQKVQSTKVQRTNLWKTPAFEV